MDTKLLARIGAGAFIAVVAAMTLLDLREEPDARLPETISVFEPDGDPLLAQLRACAAMGEVALSLPDCRAAWAEKRRRFLGQGEGSPVAAAPATDPAPSADNVPNADDVPTMTSTEDAAIDAASEAGIR